MQSFVAIDAPELHWAGADDAVGKAIGNHESQSSICHVGMTNTGRACRRLPQIAWQKSAGLPMPITGIAGSARKLVRCWEYPRRMNTKAPLLMVVDGWWSYQSLTQGPFLERNKAVILKVL
jgi:hypothetical protein